MIVLGILFALFLYYLMLTGCTWIVQWAITTWTGDPTPFWPVFAILAVISILTYRSKS